MSGRGATCDCELLFAEWAATTGSTSPSMLDQHHYWIEFSRLVDAFRRVGKLGGKASLTASTEDGLWRASLEIQTHPVSVAQPGPARHPTAQPAAPHQEDAAGRRRSRRRRGPASALQDQNQTKVFRPLTSPMSWQRAATKIEAHGSKWRESSITIPNLSRAPTGSPPVQ